MNSPFFDQYCAKNDERARSTHHDLLSYFRDQALIYEASLGKKTDCSGKGK